MRTEAKMPYPSYCVQRFWAPQWRQNLPTTRSQFCPKIGFMTWSKRLPPVKFLYNAAPQKNCHVTTSFRTFTEDTPEQTISRSIQSLRTRSPKPDSVHFSFKNYTLYVTGHQENMPPPPSHEYACKRQEVFLWQDKIVALRYPKIMLRKAFGLMPPYTLSLSQ